MPTFAPMARELVTPRLRLRPRTLADTPAIRGLYLERDHRASRRVDADGHPTLTELRDIVGEQLAESERTGLSLLAIERRDSPGFLGYCGLLAGSATVEEPEIGFELYAACHGLGYATEAAVAVVAAARATGRTRLWATVREWNAPSLNVLGKLGFADGGRRTPDAVRGDTLWLTLEL